MSPKLILSFAQKYGLKYYMFMTNILAFVLTYELSRSTQLFMLIMIVYPMFGLLLPPDAQQKSPNSTQINKQYYHMLAPSTYVFMVYFMIYYVWTNYTQMSQSYQSMFSCIVGLIFTIGQSIDASHQLIHRNQFIFRAIGFIGLIPFQFTTYPIEHLYMHHKHVGTPQDSITAPKNMSIYYYYVRAIASSYKETWKYSKAFFALCMSLNLTYFAVLYKIAIIEYENDHSRAFNKVGFFFVLAYSALFLMECIQYIQHYGLVYRKNNEQKGVLQISSWNTAENPVYNWIAFRFQRHSDHHMNAYKIYSTLQLTQKMPKFPFSFAQAVSTCWFPSIWYKVADPLVDKIIQNNIPNDEQLKNAKYIVRIISLIVGALLIVNAYIGFSQDRFIGEAL